MKRVLQSLSFLALIGACGLPLGGCKDENEAGIATDSQGTASDPKYGKDDPDTYRAFAKDHMKPKIEPKALKTGSKKG